MLFSKLVQKLINSLCCIVYLTCRLKIKLSEREENIYFAHVDYFRLLDKPHQPNSFGVYPKCFGEAEWSFEIERLVGLEFIYWFSCTLSASFLVFTDHFITRSPKLHLQDIAIYVLVRFYQIRPSKNRPSFFRPKGAWLVQLIFSTLKFN